VSLSGVFTVLRTVIVGVFTVIRAHPLGFLLSAIVLIVSWLYKVTDGFKNWGNALDAIKAPINWLIDRLGFLRGLIEAVSGGLRWLAERFGWIPSSPMPRAGASPTTVHVNQYLNIDTVRETADYEEFSRNLAEEFAYKISGV